MTGEQNFQAAKQTDKESGTRPGLGKSLLRLFLVWPLRVLAVVMLLLCLCLAGACFWLQTDSANARIQSLANGQLASSLEEQGLIVRINHLDGSLPFDWHLALELADRQGIWLRVPDLHFALNWRQLPDILQLVAIRVDDPVLVRLPDLPQQPPQPEPETAPLTLEAIQQLLGDVLNSINDLPGWLPEVRLEQIAIKRANIPASLLDPANQKDSRIIADLDMNLDWNQTKGARFGLAFSLKAVSAPLKLAVLQLGQVSADSQKEIDALSLKFDLRATPQKGKSFSGLEVTADLNLGLDDPVLEVDGLPSDCLGKKSVLELGLTTGLRAGEFLDFARFSLDKLVVDAGVAKVNGKLAWKSGKWQKGMIPDGPLDCQIDLRFDSPAGLPKDSPLAMLKTPASLRFAIGGDLFSPDLDLSFGCAKLVPNGQVVSDLDFALAGRRLGLKALLESLQNGFPADTGEIPFELAFSAKVSGQEIRLNSGIFWQGTAGSLGLAGLRDFVFKAPGADIKAGLVAKLLQQGLPLVDGQVAVRISSWQALSAFMPGIRPQGKVDVDLAASSANGQKASLALAIPDLSVAMGKDVYRLSSQVKANWQPGLVQIERLDTTARLPGVKLPLGVHLLQGTRLTYGESGLGLGGLDLALAPAGRLQASASLSGSAISGNLTLDALDLAAFRPLVPALPDGKVAAQVRLAGSPVRPSGNFKVEARGVRQAGMPVGPINAVLSGDIGHSGGSALNARLELDRATVKALGGDAATITARVPLLFGPDGVPAPDLKGKLAARVHWSGNLAPLWRMVPVADMRLAGLVKADLNVEGSMESPRLKGNLKVEKGGFQHLGFGVFLPRLDVGLKLDGGLAKNPASDALSPLDGKAYLDVRIVDAKGGKLNVGGTAGLDGKALDIRTTIENLQPLKRADVRIDLSGDVRVRGTATAPNIDGEIKLNKGVIALNKLAVASSVTTLPITKAEPAKAGKGPKPAVRNKNGKTDTGSDKTKSGKPGAASTTSQAKGGSGQNKIANVGKKGSGQKAVASKSRSGMKIEQKASSGQGSINLKVTAPRRFVVEGHGLSSEWKTDLQIKGSPFAPSILGELTAIRGTLDILTRHFVLSKGAITFAGGSIANPLLDMLLINQRSDITGTIRLHGPVSKLELELGSEPSLPRDEILARIMFGKTVNELGRMEALKLAASVATLAGFGGGDALEGIGEAFGLDSFGVGSGDDPSSASSLQMGKYINERVYVGVEQGKEPDSSAYSVQIDITPQLDLEVKSEKGNTSTGIKWKYNY